MVIPLHRRTAAVPPQQRLSSGVAMLANTDGGDANFAGRSRTTRIAAANAPPTSALELKLSPGALNTSDEIGDDFDLVNLVIPNFQARELIFDRHHQFKTIKPVSPEIITEMRFIRHVFDRDTKMLGNELANVAGGKVAFHSSWSLNDHDKVPDSLQHLTLD
jgi:hypothetical protein